MEENPETVLIGVETNFDTNLVVIPPRSATIADVREKVIEGHRALYPDYGTINIRAVKVEMFNRHFRLEDAHAVGQIFRGWQGCLHVELAGHPPHASTFTGPKLPMISAPIKAPVSPSKVCKQPLPAIDDHGDVPRNSIDKPPLAPPRQPEISLPGQQVLELSPVINGGLTVPANALDDVGSPKSSGGRNSSEKFSRDVSQDVVLHRQSGGDGQGNMMIETGLETTLDTLLNVGPEGLANVGGSKDRSSDSKGRNVGKQRGAQGTTPSSPLKPAGLENRTSGDSGISGKRTRRAGQLLNLSGSCDHQADITTSQDVHKQDGGSATKKTRIRGMSNVGMGNIHESLVKAIPDFDVKIADEKTNDVRASHDILSSESGSEIALNQESKQEGNSRHGAKRELLDVSVPLEGNKSGGITQSKVSEEGTAEAKLAEKPHAKLRSTASGFISSGSSTSGSSEKSELKEPLEKKTPDTSLQVENAKAQRKSSDESSSSGESSKSYRPGGSSGTRDVDDVVNKLVDLYSPIISDNSGGEESSDASEELQPKVLRRRMNSKALDEVDDVVERKSRRSPRAVSGLNSKFQHFIDSQDGLDELLGLTLSNRKAKTSAQVQNEPQQHVAETGSAAHDSFSIDRVPDTQVPEANCDAGIQREVYTEEIMHGERTTGKGSKTGDGEWTRDGNPDLLQNEKDEKKSSKSNSKPDLSADTNDVPPESLKNFASIASESGRRFDSNEDLLQPKSDDSQQFQAAVQLTRLAMADEDEAESDPMQSPRKSPKEKKKKKKTKVKPTDSSIAISRENDQPDNIENSAGIDLARSGLATASHEVEKHSALLAAEHSLEGGGANIAGTGLNPENIQGDAERPVSDGLEKCEDEVNGLKEAPGTRAEKLHDENLQQQMEEGRPTEAVSVDEDPVALDRNHERSELATPGKAVEKKKLNTRRIREVKSLRSRRTKENRLDTTERGGDRRGEEPASTTKQTDGVVNYIEDSPEKDCRAGADGLDEPSSFEGKGEVRPVEKSGRKKKVKKGTRPTDSINNERKEERSNLSLLEENEELIGRGIDKKESLRWRMEPEEVGAEDGLGVNEAAPMVTPLKRKKKKLKADVESHFLEGEFANEDEARSRVRQTKSNSNVSSHPSHAAGGFGYEILTSGIWKEGMGPRREIIAPLEISPQRGVDEETPLRSPVAVSKKKVRKKKASTLECAEEKDADVGMGQKELNQGTSDVEAVIQVPDVGHNKPPKPRKKATKNTEYLSPSTQKPSLLSTEDGEAFQDEQRGKVSAKKQGKVMNRRKLAEEVEFANVEDKEAAGSTKEVPAKKAKALDNGPLVESENRMVKQRKISARNQGVTPLDLRKIESSLTKDDGIAMEDILQMGTFKDSREASRKDTLKPRKKKPSVTEEVNAGVVEPGSNQVGHRGSGETELNRDVRRNAKPLDDLSRDDGSVEGHTRTKQGTKRGKSMISHVEDTVGTPSPASEKSGTKTPGSKRKKHLSSPGMNGNAGANVKLPLRGADGRFLKSSDTSREEEAPCPYPGCVRILRRISGSWYRHVKYCEKRPGNLPVPEPNKVNKSKRRRTL